jgi:hypothetical protein
MKSFILDLDMAGALALFNHIQDNPPTEPCPDLDKLEARLRLFLYDELSIEEMENPRGLERKLVAEREGRKARE